MGVGQVGELAGKPLAVLWQQLSEQAAAACVTLLNDETGGGAERDGQLLSAIAHWGADPDWEQYSDAAVDLVGKIVQAKLVDGYWPSAYIGVGVSGLLALAGGLAAYAPYAADEHTDYWMLAREEVLHSLALCDRDDYIGLSQRGEQIADGTRCLGDWTAILAVSTRLLCDRADRELQIAAARAVAAILNCHYNPDSYLLVELTSSDFFLIDGERGTYVDSGVAFAAFRVLIAEAERGGEEKLMSLVERYMRQHLEMAWDPVAGGVRGAWIAGAWNAEKTTETQGATLAALAAIVAYRGGDWEVEWFARIYEYWTQCKKTNPLAHLRHSVHCVASLHGLVQRGGLPALEEA